jgi:hypothetical protein
MLYLRCYLRQRTAEVLKTAGLCRTLPDLAEFYRISRMETSRLPLYPDERSLLTWKPPLPPCYKEIAGE